MWFNFPQKLRLKQCWIAVILLSFFSCSEQVPTEPPSELIIGAWEATMIVSDEGSFTAEEDSSLFYVKQKRKQLSFNSKGFFQENGVFLNSNPYWVVDGQLVVVKESDTLISSILQIDRNRMVLLKGGVRTYYQRFVY